MPQDYSDKLNTIKYVAVGNGYIVGTIVDKLIMRQTKNIHIKYKRNIQWGRKFISAGFTNLLLNTINYILKCMAAKYLSGKLIIY